MSEQNTAENRYDELNHQCELHIVSDKKEYTVDLSKRKGYLFVKRVFDIVVSLVALIILSPLFLVVSLIIFLQDFHSPIFKQVRVTKDGREFVMYKFRSMCFDAESKLASLKDANEADGPVFKIKDDPRITKIGKFIRKTSIDELLQLVNILKGDMSIVGPRPPLPNEVEQYTQRDRKRLAVKTGLTCYWQCSRRNHISFDKWVELDLKYIDEMSCLTDIKIIFMTIKAVFKFTGC